MSITSIAKHTTTIQTSTNTPDSMGGESRTWSTRGGLTGIPTSIQNQSSKRIDEFARRGIAVTHALYTEIDVSACTVGDRIIDQLGNVYVVTYASDMAGQMRCWAIYAELQPPTGPILSSVEDGGSNDFTVLLTFFTSVLAGAIDVTKIGINSNFPGSGDVPDVIVAQISASEISLRWSAGWDADMSGEAWSALKGLVSGFDPQSGTVS